MLERIMTLMFGFAIGGLVFSGDLETSENEDLGHQSVTGQQQQCINEYDRCRTVEDFITYSSVFKIMQNLCQEAAQEKAEEYAQKGYRNASGQVQFGPNSFEQIVTTPDHDWRDIVLDDGFVSKDEQIHLEDNRGVMVPAGAVCLFNTDTLSVEMFTIRYD